MLTSFAGAFGGVVNSIEQQSPARIVPPVSIDAGSEMNGGIGMCDSSAAAKALLTLRRNLARSEFLRQHFYTRDESKFVDSTYVYWIRLHREHDSSEELEIFSQDVSIQLKAELNLQLEQKIFARLPDVFSDLVKLSPKVEPEDSVRECLAERERRLKERLPTGIPYGIFFLEINRLIAKLDDRIDLRPSAEEFDALFDHHSRNALKQARARFPELWDEVKGHYVLDSRGSIFAKALANGLRERGHLVEGRRFVDLGSGTGTMVAAVQRYTDAFATGVEQHLGVMRLAGAMMRRLDRKGCCRDDRIDFITGDVFQARGLDLAHYDVLYVYSPIGRWEIDIDDVIDRMRTGAILATSLSPKRNASSVEVLEPIAGLRCFRKVTAGSRQS